MLTRAGLELEDPRVTVPWGIRPPELWGLFRSSGREDLLRLVTDGYIVLRCRTLGGLETQLGFHFTPRSEKGRLAELELFDNGQKDLKASYDLYESHLEQLFGRPSRSKPGTVAADLPWHEWRTRGVRVRHYVMERFGPEEHLRATRSAWLPRWL